MMAETKIDTKVYHRDVEQLIKDFLWPRCGLFDPYYAPQRLQAIAKVLCRLPEHDYEKLRAVEDTFTWFIPHYYSHGWIEPVFATIFEEMTDSPGIEYLPYTKLLYLSPRLEEAAWDIVVAVVGHELAHLVLGHKAMGIKEGEYAVQEQAAFDLLCEWGFDLEAKKLRAMHKRRETMLHKFLEGNHE